MKVYLRVTLEASLLDEQPGRELSVAAALTAARDGVKEALNRAASNGFNHKYSDTIGLAVEDVAVVVGDKPENAEGDDGIIVELRNLEGNRYYKASKKHLRAILKMAKPSDAGAYIAKNCPEASVPSDSESDLGFVEDIDVEFGGGTKPEAEWKKEWNQVKRDIRSML